MRSHKDKNPSRLRRGKRMTKAERLRRMDAIASAAAREENERIRQEATP